MANANQPSGFRPVCYRSGAPYNGAANRYYKDTTAGVIGIGDIVIRGTNSSSPDGYPEIVRAAADAAITGVVVGIEPIMTNLSQQGYLLAADVGYVLVADDPNLLFEVQEGGSGTSLAVTNIGEHIDSSTPADADTFIGRSKTVLDNAALATGNQWRIEGLVHRADNAVGAYAKWLVSPNLHTEINASATNLTEI